MNVVCEQSPADFRVGYEGFNALPDTDPAKALQAYVVGTFSGGGISSDSKPFLITSNERIVASGSTWTWNEVPIFLRW